MAVASQYQVGRYDVSLIHWTGVMRVRLCIYPYIRFVFHSQWKIKMQYEYSFTFFSENGQVKMVLNHWYYRCHLPNDSIHNDTIDLPQLSSNYNAEWKLPHCRDVKTEGVSKAKMKWQISVKIILCKTPVFNLYQLHEKMDVTIPFSIFSEK